MRSKWTDRLREQMCVSFVSLQWARVPHSLYRKRQIKQRKSPSGRFGFSWSERASTPNQKKFARTFFGNVIFRPPSLNDLPNLFFRLFYERGKGATLGDVARLLDLASKLGRLSTGLATDKTELTGPDNGPIRVEFEEMLKKVYGEVIDVEGRASSVESQKQLTEGK